MSNSSVYIKHHIDNDKWEFVLKEDPDIVGYKAYLTFDSIDEAENYLYLHHRDEPDHYMIVTYDGLKNV